MESPDLTNYIAWIEDGVSFSIIREDLLKHGVPAEDIKPLLEELDHEIWARKQKKINESQGWQWIIAGIILATASILLFMVASLPLMFFAFAGLGSGLSMIVWGKKLKTQNPDTQKRLNKREAFKNRTS